MNLDRERALNCLKTGGLERLFIEELGWAVHSGQLPVEVDGEPHVLQAIAEKRGVQALLCPPDADGRIPDYATRRKIETQVAKSVYEHLILFVDADRQTQVWQWVLRQPGQPARTREHHYSVDQPGEALLQKLESICFPLSEEEAFDLTGVVFRLRDAFDRDRVTKRFYDRFKREHAAFLKFIKGIQEQVDREWYASLMLNRLMFVYFIQQKGFLDADPNYLQNRLKQMQRHQGKGKFHTFYRYFLQRLFHEGFSQQPAQRASNLEELLGHVPYLNGGLFEVHTLEQSYPDLDIPDEAFEGIFAFFDGYEWHLDTRPLANDCEINPDVLGYIFEKFINQKQMGAYYTKEDITEYIAKNTIIPYLFDAAKKACAIAFQPGSALWRLLQDDPDRTIYEPVRKGADIPLPEEIACGIEDVSRRERWNERADLEFALPTEIWREHVARRKRCHELREKLKAGEVHKINDLITFNLDIRQFAEDAISNCEGPELLRAFYRAIREVTVLDLTCGSGAFLFAALNILEPLYEACLDRMQAFVSDLGRSGEPHHPQKFCDFREVLAEVEGHPNRAYFTLKSILVRNLYGVDIMAEAVEICKLRMFLKLVAQVDQAEDLEPLPDIDFNVRTGNTLVGFVTVDEVRRAAESDAKGQGKLVFDEGPIRQIEEQVEIVERAFGQFHAMQTEQGMDAEAFRAAKGELRDRLNDLTDQLDRYLAREYGVDPDEPTAYEAWRKSHQPFHWFAEFYGIMGRNGFDVIIGNPPYLEMRQVNYRPRNLATIGSGAIHAMCIERSVTCLRNNGGISMIVPLAIVSTQRMVPVQRILEANRATWYVNFAWRPAKLFDTVNRALTIFVARSNPVTAVFSTNYQKWTSDTRDFLMPTIVFTVVPHQRPSFWVPKLGCTIESEILDKFLTVQTRLSDFVAQRNNNVIYYRTTGGLYWKVFTPIPPAFRINGQEGHSSRETKFMLQRPEWVVPTIAALSSDVFWWWYTVTSNLRDLNPSDLNGFPFPETLLSDDRLEYPGQKYINDISRNSTMLVRRQRQTGTTETQSFRIQLSKPILDEIDRVLAQHYGFTDEELDFIINYDIKYRIGI